MQHKAKNMKRMKILLGLSFTMMAFTFSTLAGGSTPSGFTFSYKLGTVATNYHIYAVVSQVGSGTQPKGTVVLDNWWVKDLGRPPPAEPSPARHPSRPR